MKTRFILASFAFAAVAFVSCSKNEIILMPAQNNFGDTPVEFGMYLPIVPDMKGLETTNKTLTANNSTGFGVNAAYTNGSSFNLVATDKKPDFMYNQKVLYNGTDWTYSPKKYWPETTGDKISFFAWAPYDKVTVLGVEQPANKLKFSIDADPLNTVDFVAGAIVDKTKPSKDNLSTAEKQGMEFKLKHELTRMTFNVVATDELFVKDDATRQTKLIITDVKILAAASKVYQTGTYTFGNTTEAIGSWELNSADIIKTDYSLKTIANLSAITADMGGYTNPNCFAVTGTTPVSFFDTDHYLYLIPSNGTAGLANDGDVTVQFSYDLVTINSDSSFSSWSATKDIKFKKGTLQQGKSYAVTFRFTTDGILMSADALAWEDGDPITETVPQV